MRSDQQIGDLAQPPQLAVIQQAEMLPSDAVQLQGLPHSKMLPSSYPQPLQATSCLWKGLRNVLRRALR